MGTLVRSVPYVLYDEPEVLVTGIMYQCRMWTWILPGVYSYLLKYLTYLEKQNTSDTNHCNTVYHFSKNISEGVTGGSFFPVLCPSVTFINLQVSVWVCHMANAVLNAASDI